MTLNQRAFGFLVNPASGSDAAEAAVPLARRLREAGRDVTVTFTRDAESTPEVVAEILNQERAVVSVGGDGTVASVAGAVIAGGGVLAVIPAGRGNDFARMLNLPTTTKQQAEMLLAGVSRPVDVLTASWDQGGRRDQRVVAGSVYSGVDAMAADLVRNSRAVRSAPTALQYPVAAVAALANYRPFQARLEVDGRFSEHQAATVVVANSAYYGKGMKIAPDADVADGRLDVVVVEAASRFELIRSLPKVYQGKHADLDAVTVLRGTTVRLSGAIAGNKSVPVGADGEELLYLPSAPTGGGETALEVAVQPGALKLITP